MLYETTITKGGQKIYFISILSSRGFFHYYRYNLKTKKVEIVRTHSTEYFQDILIKLLKGTSQ